MPPSIEHNLRTKCVCRLCLQVTKKGFNIFQYKNYKLHLQIRDLVAVKLVKDDPLPKIICQNCRQKLIVMQKFIDLCRESDLKLHKIYEDEMLNDNEVKNENRSTAKNRQFIDTNLNQCRKEDVPLNNVPSPEVERFNCKVCQRSFPDVICLQIHVQVHVNELNRLKEMHGPFTKTLLPVSKNEDAFVRLKYPEPAHIYNANTKESNSEDFKLQESSQRRSEDEKMAGVSKLRCIKESRISQSTENLENSEAKKSPREPEQKKEIPKERKEKRKKGVPAQEFGHEESPVAFIPNKRIKSEPIEDFIPGMKEEYITPDYNEAQYSEFETNDPLCNSEDTPTRMESPEPHFINPEMATVKEEFIIPEKSTNKNCETKQPWTNDQEPTEDEKQDLAILKKSRLLNCSMCFKVYKLERCLVAHERTHLQEGEGANVTCNECNKTFSLKSELSMHMKLHFAPYHCTVCKKPFQLLYKKLQHESSHAQQKISYTCPFCTEGFVTFKRFMDHMVLHKNTKTARRTEESAKLMALLS